MRARSILDLPAHLRDQAKAKLGGVEVAQKRVFPQRRVGKFGAQRVAAGGKKFDSKKEFMKFRELELRQAAGEISGLRLHVKFSLFDAGGACRGEHIGTYTADFVWKEGGKLVVADAKSEATRRKETWPRVKKLMRMCHSIEVVEL